MVCELNSTLIWKGKNEERKDSNRLFQSKEAILGIGGITIKVNGMPSYPKGFELVLKKTQLLVTSLFNGRGCLSEDCIDQPLHPPMAKLEGGYVVHEKNILVVRGILSIPLEW
jgi:hypothetical protein